MRETNKKCLYVREKKIEIKKNIVKTAKISKKKKKHQNYRLKRDRKRKN